MMTGCATGRGRVFGEGEDLAGDVGPGDWLHGGAGVVPRGEVRADRGDHHVGAPDSSGGEAGSKMSGLVRISARPEGRSRGAVDSPDLVAALRGEGHDVGTDAARGSEDGDVHGQVLLTR
jgi:hypothetical protein